MVSYGWTIDYINENVTVAQIMYLVDEIRQNPPSSIMNFGLGEDKREEKLLSQIDAMGDKVKYDKWFNKKSVKSVTRLRDGVKIK